MCGITGFVDFGGGTTEGDRARLQGMMDALRHRGPDAEGCFLDDRVALGHRRLSIIDVAGGQQPISNEDGTVTLIYNGQIYNHLELRRRLEEAGHRFKTRCDTEVVVHLYEEEGNDCVRSLRGMFAFAIWDQRKGKLFLARDRLGIKPLYVSESGTGSNPHRFFFGSELKSILLGLEGRPEIDPRAVMEFMTFLYVPSPLSIYRGLRKLPPASWMEVTREGARQEVYWDVSFEPEERSPEEFVEEILENVQEAVSLRLMSEVPLGAFLSGGTDSAAVVWAMSRAREERAKTVTVGFSESAFDEREVARSVARSLGTDHREIEVQPSAAEVLESLSWNFDEPFGDSSLIPTYYVSKAARERVTVALSGDGGDENFAGYRRYRYDVLENRLRGLLPGPLRWGVGLLGRGYPKADWLPRPLRAKTLLTNLSRDPVEAYYRSVSCILPEVRDSVLSGDLLASCRDYDPLDRVRSIYDSSGAPDGLSRIQHLDLKTYLPDDILTKVDRASMAVSLEVRVPLLDHRIVELAARIPSRFKLVKGTGKWILREAIRPHVPREVVDGSKKGFSIPLRRWMKDDFSSLIRERVLENPAPFFDGDRLKSLDGEHRRGLADHSTVLFGALVFHLWYDRFVRENTFESASLLSSRGMSPGVAP